MSKKPIKLVVFDMAGTTVHDENFVAKALCEALSLHGYEVPVDDANKVMGIAKPVAIGMLLDQHGGNRQNIPAIHQDFLRIMIRFYKEMPGIREMDGAAETFRTLRQKGVKVALDTGFSRDITDTILDRLGWLGNDVLDATVASDEVPNGRPHADMIFRAMEQTGITDVAMVAKVGDTPVDLQEGANAGCGLVIGVLSGVNGKEELLRYPHSQIIGSVKEVPALVL